MVMRFFKHPLLWVTLALMVMFAVGGNLAQRATSQKQPETESQSAQQKKAVTGPVATLQDKPPAREYQPDCNDPKNADLCAQRRMAKAAEEQIVLNWFGLALLFGTLAFTGWAAVSARGAAHSAKDSVEVANKTLVATQRPWVSVTVSVASSLVFRNGAGRLTFDFIMKNFGNSPAINVELDYKIVLHLPEAWDVMQEVSEAARRRLPSHMLGHKIFPTDRFRMRVSIPIERAAIEAAAERLGVPALTMISLPSMVCCVVYNSAFSTERYATEIIAHFGKRVPENPKLLEPFETADGEYPAADIGIQLSFGSGGAT